MSEEFNSLNKVPTYMGYSWPEAMLSALLRPSVDTFERLSNVPGATSRKAFTWVFKASILGGLVVGLAGQIIGPSEDGLGGTSGAILTAALSVLLFAVFVVVVYIFGKALGGTGTYARLAFTIAAFYAPIELATSIVFLFDGYATVLVSLINSALFVYAGVLAVIAVKAVHHFGWGKAIASTSLILAAQFCILGLGVIELAQPDLESGQIGPWVDLPKIETLGTWPSAQISAGEAVTLDLSHLGLVLSNVESARVNPEWSASEWEHQEGIVIHYGTPQQNAVSIWTLKYEDIDTEIGFTDDHNQKDDKQE